MQSVDGPAGPRWVITYADGEYTIYQGFPGQPRYSPMRHFVRTGDTLAREGAGRNPIYDMEISLDGEHDRLLWKNTDPGLPQPAVVTMARVSDSTALPTPVPQ